MTPIRPHPPFAEVRNLIIARAVIAVLNRAAAWDNIAPMIPIPRLPRFLSSDPRFL